VPVKYQHQTPQYTYTTIQGKTQLSMIGNLFSGLFGKTDAEITDTVFFDVSIGGSNLFIRNSYFFKDFN
jgi:hypothetical protein